MAKNIGQAMCGRAKFATLAAANADRNLAPNQPATVMTEPPSGDYAVVPVSIFAQAQLRVPRFDANYDLRV